MIKIEIKTQCRKIGTVEIVNRRKCRGGKYEYLVTYEVDGMKIECGCRHNRQDGIIKLVMLAMKELQKAADWYWDIPKDKIIDGAILVKDIPEHYREAFFKDNPCMTAPVLESGPAIWITDVEGWLRKMKTGISPVWD